MDNDESRKFGAEGGKKRAANLTREERSEAARKAALARWGMELPYAKYPGTLEIGDLKLPCAVLSDDRTRVLTQTDFMKGMGMYYSGWVARNRTPEDRAADVPHFLSSKSLKPFIDKHLGDLQSITVRYVADGGRIAMGIKAEIIPKICEIWMDADDAGQLTGARQKQIAAKARKLMRALAYKMIEVLVDDATGFREDREQREIARIVQQYVTKEMRDYVRTFPRSFFEQLCRLRGVSLRDDMQTPRYFGHLINDIVWDRLAPGVREALQRLNPSENGRRKHKHFQFLTKPFGDPRLSRHLGLVEGLAEGFGDGEWTAFYAKLDVKLPSHRKSPLFAGIAAPVNLPKVRKQKALPASVSASAGVENLKDQTASAE
jgi:hypothetical protein